MNSKLAKRIQEMFRVSEIITVNEEAITPIYKVRENAEKFSIKEVDLKGLSSVYPHNSSENIPPYGRR